MSEGNEGREEECHLYALIVNAELIRDISDGR